jgi:hypothetical protein
LHPKWLDSRILAEVELKEKIEIGALEPSLAGECTSPDVLNTPPVLAGVSLMDQILQEKRNSEKLQEN